MAATLMPRERRFFVLLREAVDNLRTAIRVFEETVESGKGFSDAAAKLKDLEHLGDEVTHRIIQELNGTFITPFDREDIFGLAKKLDDVLDLVEETADTIVLDGIEEISEEARGMAAILGNIGDELVNAISILDSRDRLLQYTIRIHELENQADSITREAISTLFRTSQDAIHIIKWKDVYALLEKTVDTTEDIANILESVSIKGT